MAPIEKIPVKKSIAARLLSFLELFEHTLFLIPIKFFLSTPTYFQALAPIIGMLYFPLKFKKLDRLEATLLILPLYAYILGIIHWNMEEVLRGTQLLFIIFFFYYIKDKVSIKTLLTNLKILILLSCLVFPIQFILQKNMLFTPNWFGLSIGRLQGILGEYNFSGALYFGCFALFYLFKEYKWVPASVLCVVGTVSRGAMLSLFLFMGLVKGYKKFGTKLKWLTLPFLLYPFFVVAIGQLPYKYAEPFHNMSSQRTSIQYGHMQVFGDNPLGVGYFRGDDYLKANRKKYPVLRPQEQHNLLIQMLTELGIIGYLVLAYVIFQAASAHPVFALAAIIPFTFLNGIHEFIFWVFLALAIRSKKQETQEQIIPFDQAM